MLVIRKGMFETNSSSCHTFVYESYTIPIIIRLKDVDYHTDPDGFILWDYYEKYNEDFISWLYKIGVQEVYVDDVLQEKTESNVKIELINRYCEGHPDHFTDEDAVIYNLFGNLLDESNNDRNKCQMLRDKYWDSNYFVSDWFV